MYNCRLLILDGINNCSPETDAEVSIKAKTHTTEIFGLSDNC